MSSQQKKSETETETETKVLTERKINQESILKDLQEIEQKRLSSRLRSFYSNSFLSKINPYSSKLGAWMVNLALIFALLNTYALVFEKFDFNPFKSLEVDAAAIPTTTIDLPSEQLIGEDFSFTVTFDNTDLTDAGYGPYVDIIFPVNGADGNAGSDIADGISFNSANYLGAGLTTTELVFPDDDGAGPGTTGTVDHPYAVDNTGAPIPVIGTAGDTLVVVELPFGSFTNEQPEAEITILASLSNLADASTPLTISANAGFRYGNDALNNYSSDPSIIGTTSQANITPTLFSLSKSNNGPESETATGPNFLREYTIEVDIADGQTINNFEFQDFVDNNLVYTQILSATPASCQITPPALQPSTINAVNPPNNQLTVDCGSVTGGPGGVDASLVFEYYIPDQDADTNFVIDHDTGDDVVTENDARAEGLWTPTDTRDVATTVVSDISSVDDVLTDKSIAIQKSSAVVNDPQANGFSPDDTVEYTLNVQISDYFAFENLLIEDIFSDGQRFDNSFTPTLSVTHSGNTSSGNLDPANFVITDHFTGGTPAVAPIDGTQELDIDISAELILRGQNGQVLGGCIPISGGSPNCSTYNAGPTTMTLTYRSIIQDSYSDDFPSGDSSVDQGDSIDNTVEVIGDVLENVTLAPTGFDEADTSSESLLVPQGVVTKEIYAINGNTGFGSIQVEPGDTVTYRFQYSLPTSDVEDLSFDDYLPLPVFLASEVTTFDGSAPSATTPPAGTSKFGPGDTFFGLSGITPTISTNATANSVTWTYGDFDSPTEASTNIDILFTVTASSEPFADGFFLTNLVRGNESGTSGASSEADDLIQIELAQPVLNITKGLVSVDANTTGTVFSPVTVAPVTFGAATGGVATCLTPGFTGSITSANLETTPIDSDLGDVDAGDIVRYAIVIENTGSSSNGAFDVTISDLIPTGMTTPSGGANLCVTNGNGTAIGYTGDLFTTPIVLNDGIGVGSLLDGSHINGENIAVITFDLQVSSTSEPGAIVTNTANLTNYAGDEGATNHIPEGLSDEALLSTLLEPSISKSVTGTNQTQTSGNDVVIGEIVEYTVDINLAEGTYNNASFFDRLDNGLVWLQIDSITRSSTAITTDQGAGDFSDLAGTESVTSIGRNVTLDLGTVINADTDNTTDESLTIVYRAVVENEDVNNSGDNRDNAVDFIWDQGVVETSAPDVTIVEPNLDITKTANPTSGDAGDTVTYTFVIDHNGGSEVDTYDIEFEDILPPKTTYVTSSFSYLNGSSTATGPVAVDDSLAATTGLITATIGELQLGEIAVFEAQVTLDVAVSPSELIANTAEIQWTSIPGDPGQISPVGGDPYERTGDNSDPGELNNYIETNNANVNVDDPVFSKNFYSGFAGPDYTNQAHTVGSNVAIGEQIQYEIVATIPEGTSNNAQIVDDMDPGLGFISLDEIIFDTGVSTDFGSGPSLNDRLNQIISQVNSNSNGDVINDGNEFTIPLGNLVNTDTNNATAENITIRYTAVIINDSTTNNGVTVGNLATYTWDTGSQTDSAPDLTIIEPNISIDKTINIDEADADDTLTYTVTIDGSLSAVDSFDLDIVDTIPAGLTYQTGSLDDPFGAGFVFDESSNPTLNISLASLPAGTSAQFTYQVVVSPSVLPNQIITNTANLEWTSLPGDVTIAQSSFNSLSTERTGDDTDPGTTSNDYLDSDQTSVEIYGLEPFKRIISTSESITGGVSGTERLVVGEIVRYRLEHRLPEINLTNFEIRDSLPAGLSFVDDGTATVGFVSNGGGVNSSAISGTGLELLGNEGNVSSLPPSFVIPNNSITTSPLSFNLGDVSNTDRDSDNEYIVIEFNAVVQNVASNQAGTSLPNSYQAFIDGNLNVTSNTVNAVVAEPDITLNKFVTTSPIDAGDTIVYEIQITNSSSGANAASAMDVNLTDVIDSNLNLVSINPGNGINNSIGNNLSIDFAQIDPGLSETVIITATVLDSTPAGIELPNTANIVYTSLPDSGTTINPTGSDPNTVSTERDGSGGINDYLTNDNADLTLANSPTIQKLNPTNTDYVIGELITYPIIVTLQEGNTQSLVITDQIPDGLEFESYTIDQSNYNGTIVGPSDNSPTGSGSDLILDFGNTITSGDGDASNNSFIIQVSLRVINILDNQNGDTYINQVLMEYQNPNTLATESESDTTNPVLLLEPELEISKTASDPSPNFGEEVRYTLTVSHLPSSTTDAQDIVLTDTLPAGLSYAGSPDLPTNWSINVTGQVVTITGSILALGDIANIEYNAQVGLPENLSIGDDLINTVNLNWTSISDSDSFERNGDGGVNDYFSSNNETVTVDGIDLKIVKDDGVTVITPGESINYEIVVTNNGSVDASGVVVTETVPVGSSFDSDSSTPGWVCTPDGLAGSSCSLLLGGDLAPGDSSIINFVIDISDSIPSNLESLTNTAVVTDDGSKGADANPTDNTDDDVNDLEASPDLEIIKDNSVTIVNPQDTVTYTLQITNSGNQAVSNFEVIDSLPEEVSFVSGSDNPTESAGQISWIVDSIEPGQTITRTVTVTVNDALADSNQITNVATVTTQFGSDTDPTPENNTSSDIDTLEAQADMRITKTANLETLEPGDLIIYTINYQNLGNREATDVIITENVPLETTFEPSSSSAGWVCSPDQNAGSECQFDLGNLAAGLNQNLNFAVRVDQIIDIPNEVIAIQNTASIDSTNDTNPENNQDNQTLFIDFNLATVCGVIFFDENRSADISQEEEGVGNVVINITDSRGVVHTVTTDPNGEFCWQVAPGEGSIEILANSLPERYEISTLEVGGLLNQSFYADANGITNVSNVGLYRPVLVGEILPRTGSDSTGSNRTIVFTGLTFALLGSWLLGRQFGYLLVLKKNK